MSVTLFTLELMYFSLKSLRNQKVPTKEMKNKQFCLSKALYMSCNKFLKMKKEVFWHKTSQKIRWIKIFQHDMGDPNLHIFENPYRDTLKGILHVRTEEKIMKKRIFWLKMNEQKMLIQTTQGGGGNHAFFPFKIYQSLHDLPRGLGVFRVSSTWKTFGQHYFVDFLAF